MSVRRAPVRSKAHIFVASKGDYYALADDGLLRFDDTPRAAPG